MDNKCQSCGGTLVFDADLQMMVCDRCTAMVPVEETTKKHVTAYKSYENPDGFGSEVTGSMTESFTQELMDVSVYECKNCGAELSINEVEAATYCAYCGQPTIVFSRIEKRKRPQYIIPFKINKNQAITNIREKLLKSDYVSDEVKHFKPELLRGIYIPYGMFCYHIRDKQIIYAQTSDVNGNVGEGSPFRYHFREADSLIGHIPVDASYQLSNESADRLEPFFGQDLVEFDTGYLSGYYADLRDEDFSLLKSKADARAKEMFLQKMQALPYLVKPKTVKSNPEIECVKQVYALLPVWFLVFEDDGEKYTIMVNGQTGKVVGAVPTSLKTFVKWVAICFCVAMLFAIPLSFVAIASGFFMYVIGAILIGSPVMIVKGILNIKRLNKSIGLTTAKSIRTFATERQDI